MKLRVTTFLLAALGAWHAAPVVAHHSFAAEFDADSPIDLTGVVTKIEWRNPHTDNYGYVTPGEYYDDGYEGYEGPCREFSQRVFIDVETPQGEYENWALEMGSPNGLMRRGWTRNSLQIGDEVSIEGSRAKDGSLKGNVRSVVLSNGERLFAGSSQNTDESEQ